MSSRWKLTLTFLTLITATIWFAILALPDQKLHIIACDVGQGDAILAVYGTTQVLVDGGPDKKVLDCLSKYLPFWDREIELVILSHPQKDHYMGLIDVFKHYRVDNLMATPLDSSSREWAVLKSLVGGSRIRVINPKKDMRMRIGLIYLDILWPSEEFLAESLQAVGQEKPIKSQQFDNSKKGVLGAYVSNKDPNEFSIVLLLNFKDFDALLTGDASPKVSDKVAKEFELNPSLSGRSVEYIKVPHHGSKNGLTTNLLDATKPEVAVISVGKNNSYGHPHQEIIKLLSDKGIKTLRTDQTGDVVIETNGESYWQAGK